MTPVPSGLQFSLVTDRGVAVDQSVAHGALALFFFGFTHCRMVCPRALAKLSASLDDLGPHADAVRAFYVTVDPERDSPEVMRSFLAEDYPRFMGLTGEPAQLEAFRRSLHVFSRRAADPEDPDGYAMPHSAFTYVFAPDGRYLEHFGDAASAEDITAALRKLVKDIR